MTKNPGNLLPRDHKILNYLALGNLSLDITKIIKKVKNHPNYGQVGMVLYHNGVVRNTSRNGSMVKGLKVEVDYKLLDEVINKYKKKGIIDIIVKINDGKNLLVGDDVMFIAVAGDIRENVISTLTSVLNTIKSEVTKKTEFFV